MMRERSYLTWLAACGAGAAALVGVAGLVGSDAVPRAARTAVSVSDQKCTGTLWTTAGGTRVCLQSAPFAVDSRVQRRIGAREGRTLTPTELRRMLESHQLPGIPGRLINPPALGVAPGLATLPVGMSAFRSGSALLQVDRPCQDENATL